MLPLPVLFLLLLLAYYGYGFSIAKRPGREQDCWPQVRVLAKTRGCLLGWFSEPVATFLTEALSGLLHAMAVWGLCEFPGEPISNWKWVAAALTLVFWLGIGFGRGSAAENRLRALRKQGDEVASFLANPVPCLLPHKDEPAASVWSKSGCLDIYVRFQNKVIGYVQGVNVNTATGIVTIDHFAVASGLERKGVGRRLAHAIRSEFACRFKAREIRFLETSSKYVSAGYVPFFQSLGAVPVNNPPNTHPDWHWKV